MTRQELITLSEVPLFRGIDILDLEAFFKDKVLRTESFSKDAFAALQGDEYNELIILLEGQAGAMMAAPGGKVVRIETLQAPCVAATAVLFSTERVLPVSLQSMGGDLLCLRLPRALVIEMMQKFPSLLEAYLTENGDKLLFLAEKIRLFQFKSLRQKIVGHLMLLCSRQGSHTFRMNYSREALAQLMGVARPSLSREFSALVQEGLIEASGKEVHIPDPEALKAVLDRD